MTEDKLNEMANGILKEFGPKYIFELLNDFYGSEEHNSGDIYSLLDLYDTSEDLDAELQQHLNGELREVRLLATAIIISRLADKYARVFKKISTRYHGFHDMCQKIAKKEQA